MDPATIPQALAVLGVRREHLRQSRAQLEEIERQMADDLDDIQIIKRRLYELGWKG